MTADRPRRSRSRNTSTPTTAYVSIGSTESKNRSRFSLNSAAARWHSSRSATYRAELSIAAETSSYLGKVGANLRRELRSARRLYRYLECELGGKPSKPTAHLL